jgi:hypothetical protein
MQPKLKSKVYMGPLQSIMLILSQLFNLLNKIQVQRCGTSAVYNALFQSTALTVEQNSNPKDVKHLQSIMLILAQLFNLLNKIQIQKCETLQSQMLILSQLFNLLNKIQIRRMCEIFSQ